LPGSSGRTDTEIAQAVRRAFEWDVFVPEEQIMSTVSEGVVTLTGFVEAWAEREDAERAVRNLLGVRGVTNRIEVRPKKQVTANEIRHSVEEALERHALREAQKLDLKVEEGKVTLSGRVASWKERDAVLGAVKGTLGVRKLEDKLRIEP
jgi:osmotically-inducible protein OsmY